MGIRDCLNAPPAPAMAIAAVCTDVIDSGVPQPKTAVAASESFHMACRNLCHGRCTCIGSAVPHGPFHLLRKNRGHGRRHVLRHCEMEALFSGLMPVPVLVEG